MNLRDYIDEIIRSFEEISAKEFILNLDDSIKVNINKSTEIMYGLRNFVEMLNLVKNKYILI